MDFMTPEQRHRNMCNIKQKNTLPEQIIMKELRRQKIYFSKHVKDLPGKPDVVFKRKKIAVFIDSEFWHGRANLPKSNTEFWLKNLNIIGNTMKKLIACYLKKGGKLFDLQIKKSKRI